MLRRHNRLLVALHVLTDFLSATIAFTLAYLLRFETGLIPITLGQPPFLRYLALAPIMGVLLILAFQVQGIYRLRRGRTRVDDFFGVLVGTLLATLLGVMGTLYVQNYHLSEADRAVGLLQVSRLVWA